MEKLPIRRAILSVTDKTGLVEFAEFLVGRGVDLVSTGGTCKVIAEAGLPVTQVSDITGFPEIMGGRVKTLHPVIHGGILADKDNPDHMAALKEHAIVPFDLVCVNLYKFADAVEKGLDLRASIEEIDIGGPCMLRASAKNFHSVAVVPSINWYQPLMKEMQENDTCLSLATRKQLAEATFAATSEYDAMIAGYLARTELG